MSKSQSKGPWCNGRGGQPHSRQVIQWEGGRSAGCRVLSGVDGLESQGLRSDMTTAKLSGVVGANTFSLVEMFNFLWMESTWLCSKLYKNAWF